MSARQVVHPARETLTAFGSGKLEPAEAVAVEEHIAECEECCETLHGLGSDTFVDLLRESNAVQLDSMVDGTVALSETQNETVCDLPVELTNHPRYRVLELLGKGGMGNVYKAEHTLMNRTVALKLINQELVQNNQAVERFRREVQSAARLVHPNIVTAFDAEQAGDVHYLVMEYMPGDNLSDVVKRDGPLEIAKACDFVRQAANGLQHAHEEGMVHRDIKPHNLMVTSSGRIKILDFGLATLAVEALPSGEKNLREDSDHRGSPNLTSAGSMMGTPDFISPEQASDARAADIRSDIYSLGCTFYYLLTGRPPFTEGSALERVKAHGEAEPDPIENFRKDIPSGLVEIVRRMMAKDPGDRYQTPADVTAALAPQATRQHTTILKAVACAFFAFILAGVIYVATDNGTLVVDSEDDSVEVTILGAQMRIVDTVTGSSVKRLRSGEYVLALKGDENEYELNKDRFVLKRGGRVIVQVTRKEDRDESGTTVRRVWSRAVFGGAPSPDGRYVSHLMRGDLAVRDLIQGTSRRLTNNPEPGEFAYIQVWSPSGKEIVTSWWLPDEHQFDLRIVPLDGGNPRTIYFDKEHYVKPLAWSNSGDILMVRGDSDKVAQLVLISVADGEARLLKSLGWNWPMFASISPDGRYVVYDMPQQDGSSKRDIFILSTKEGGSEERLVEHPNNDHSPLWAPDGKRVVFTSDRNKSENLWVLAVENGRPDGIPHPTNVDMTRAKPRGIAQDGTYFYSDSSSGGTDVYVTKFDPKKRVISGQSTKITRRNEGFNSRPAWSRDGRQLAFVSDSNLVIQSVENSKQRELELDGENLLFLNTRPRWSTDDKQILLTEGRDEKLRWGIHTIDPASGTVTSLIPPTNDYKDRPSSAAWSSDGKSVFYIRNAFQRDTFISRVAASTLGTNTERILYESTGSRSSDDYHPRRLYQSLAVSADGKQIALASTNEISVMSVTGGDARVVHQVQQGFIPMAVNILWTHDSRSIIFGFAIDGHPDRLPHNNTRLWQVSVDDGSTNEIGLVADKLSHIAMHPEGNQIAYTAAATGVSSELHGTWAISNFLPPLVETK